MFFLNWINTNPQETISYFTFYIFKGITAYITLYLLTILTSGQIEIITTQFNTDNDGTPTPIITPEHQIVHTHLNQTIKEMVN